MADISAILQKKGVNNVRKESVHYEVTMIHYSQIIPSKMQFYAQEDIEEQADNIQLAGGIMQPLVVRKKDADQYELLAGHRRLQSVRVLVEEWQLKQFAMVPCHVELANDWRAEYLLITTNGYREKSGYEKMMEVQRLTEIIPHLLGSEELKGRTLRSRIARELKIGETSVQNYNYIAAHLCPEGMEAFREGRFKTATAFELSHLSPEDQKELLKQPELTSPIIAEYTRQKACQPLTPEKTQEERKEETQLPGQREIEEYPEVLPENERKKSDAVLQKAEEENQEPTIEQKRKILHDVITETQEIVDQMKDY